MCCESCPEYEECAAKNKLKDDCCRRCPDYDSCFAADEDNEEEGY